MQETTQLIVEHEGLRWWFTLGRDEVSGQRSGGRALPSTVNRGLLTTWLLHGPDSQLIPARPTVEREPVDITVRRLKDWLTHWIYEDATRQIELDGVRWCIRREPGITVTGKSRRDRPWLAPPAGLRFTSDAGETCFVNGICSGIGFVTMPRHALVRRLVEGLR
jgi:hypothetical protein